MSSVSTVIYSYCSVLVSWSHLL